MTRRICSGCGHTLVQPRADVGGVLGEHMDAHTTMHERRGEACRWIVTEPWSFGRQLAGLLVAIVVLAAIIALMSLGTPAGAVEQGIPFPHGEITSRGSR